MILKDRKNAFVPNVKFVSLGYMTDHADYFGEATALCEQFGIGNIISFNKDFDVDLLAQFFATVYFRKEGVRSLNWMLHVDRVSCSWEVFMQALGVPFTTPDEPVGLHPHTSGTARSKSEL